MSLCIKMKGLEQLSRRLIRELCITKNQCDWLYTCESENKLTDSQRYFAFQGRDTIMDCNMSSPSDSNICLLGFTVQRYSYHQNRWIDALVADYNFRKRR